MRKISLKSIKHESKTIIKCPSCGAIGVDSVEACQAQFANVIGREFSNPEFFKAHRLTVDAYSLQHPEQYMLSSKSAAAHLTSICWSMEQGYSLNVPDTIKKWVDGARTYTRIEPPTQLFRGEINIDHVKNISDPEQYFNAVNEWGGISLESVVSSLASSSKVG